MFRKAILNNFGCWGKLVENRLELGEQRQFLESKCLAERKNKMESKSEPGKGKSIASPETWGRRVMTKANWSNGWLYSQDGMHLNPGSSYYKHIIIGKFVYFSKSLFSHLTRENRILIGLFRRFSNSDTKWVL